MIDLELLHPDAASGGQVLGQVLSGIDRTKRNPRDDVSGDRVHAHHLGGRPKVVRHRDPDPALVYRDVRDGDGVEVHGLGHLVRRWIDPLEDRAPLTTWERAKAGRPDCTVAERDSTTTCGTHGDSCWDPSDHLVRLRVDAKDVVPAVVVARHPDAASGVTTETT